MVRVHAGQPTADNQRVAMVDGEENGEVITVSHNPLTDGYRCFLTFCDVRSLNYCGEFS